MKIDEFTNYSQNMRSSLFWWYEHFDFVAEQNQTNFVIVLNGRKREYGRQLGNQDSAGGSAPAPRPAVDGPRERVG